MRGLWRNGQAMLCSTILAMANPSGIDAATSSAARLFLNRVERRYVVLDAFLFGSRARQTHRPDSDADVAILLAGPAEDFVRTKLDMDDTAYDVLLETGIRVQPWPVWQEEWGQPDSYPNPRLLRNITRDGVRL